MLHIIIYSYIIELYQKRVTRFTALNKVNIIITSSYVLFMDWTTLSLFVSIHLYVISVPKHMLLFLLLIPSSVILFKSLLCYCLFSTDLPIYTCIPISKWLFLFNVFSLTEYQFLLKRWPYNF